MRRICAYFAVITVVATASLCSIYFVVYGSVSSVIVSPKQPHNSNVTRGIYVDASRGRNSQDAADVTGVTHGRTMNVNHYNVLVFGSPKSMSQNLGFLRQDSSSGIWQHTGMCYHHSVNMRIVLGSREKDFIDQDAVVFNMDEHIQQEKIETLKTMTTDPLQAWIYYGREPVIRMRWNFPGVGALPLHGIWSHYNDSEVLMKYGFHIPGRPMMWENVSEEYWSQGKTKLVSWMARNCWETFWPRTAFVRELQKHIPVDIYGNCGTLECMPRLSQKCRNNLRRYKFYLALESAECEDYTTEKLWETALMNNVIPVVYGAQRECYQREAPPGSYIYAGDFPTVKALADYLILLNNEPDLFAKYFQWQYRGSIGQPKQTKEPLHFQLFCSIIPFISRVKERGLLKKPFSDFPFYSSCKTLKGKDAIFTPRTSYHLRNWNPRNW